MTKLLSTLLHRSSAPATAAAAHRGGPPPPAGKLRFLTETDTFQDLGAEDMAELDRMTAMTTCHRGRVFYEPGTTDEVLFILKRGRVNLSRLTPDGRKLIIATIEPGTIFGEMASIGQGMEGSHAEAAEDCTLCIMSRDDLEHLLVTHPPVAVRLVALLAAQDRGGAASCHSTMDSAANDVGSLAYVRAVQVQPRRGDEPLPQRVGRARH